MPISSLFKKPTHCLHLLNATIQAAMAIVSEKRVMELSSISQKIDVLNKMLSTTEKGMHHYKIFIYFLILSRLP